MKFFTKILIVALLCITSDAQAYEVNYSGPLPAKDHVSVKIHLPAGKAKIEIWDTQRHGPLNCQFLTTPWGVTIDQTSNLCLLRTIQRDEVEMTVNITNPEDKVDYYWIWVTDAT